MERVQFQQEQMLAELKDLVQKNLFTSAETRQIMKKRTAFETALIRRIAKKSDFLRYAAYEMGLEQLRKKRVERIKKEPAPPSISDYALVRRQFHIFERTIKKFKSDVGLWIQYINVAKREGARALVGRITARAMQMHPNTPAIYILAASHELASLSPSSARSLLQRGLRLNADSIDMWREYVSMELGFVESLRRRWAVLGIDEKMDVDGNVAQDEAAEALVADKGDAARKEIMGGAIVKSVIASAAAAVPKLPLFVALQTLISRYPSPTSLRKSLLEHLHSILSQTLPDDPGAIKLYATRHLTGKDDEGEEALVDGLKLANEELLKAVKEADNGKSKAAKGKGREGICRVYTEFVEEWCATPTVDENLRFYLIASLQSLVRASGDASPSLLAGHLRLLSVSSPPTSTSTQPNQHEKVVKTGRKYTGRVPGSVILWLARLDAEAWAGESEESLLRSWAEARKSTSLVENEKSEVERVWMWGLEGRGQLALKATTTLIETLLKESMRDSELRGIHEQLLKSLIKTTQNSNDGEMLSVVRHMAKAYLPTAEVWAILFQTLAGSTTTTHAEVFEEIYGAWKRKDGGADAVVAWAGWLFRVGKGAEAMAVVVAARSWLEGDERDVLEARWMKVVDSHGGEAGEDDENEGGLGVDV